MAIPRIYTYISLAILLIASTSCDLTREVELEIPPYDNPYVVEGYLEPGQPYFVVLTRGQAYFDTIRVETVEDADVKISYGTDTVELAGLLIDLNDPQTNNLLDELGADLGALGATAQLFGNRLYLYVNLLAQVPAQYDLPFKLYVRTQDGTEITAETRIPNPVPIEKVEYFFDSDTLARTQTTFVDPPNEDNFYRRLLEQRVFSLDSVGFDPGAGETVYDTIWGSQTIQDFYLSDADLSSPPTFGTFNDFAEGDTLVSTLYTVTEDNVRFVDTRDAAINAAFSPFGQPARLHSNVVGGSGIFVGYSSNVQRVVIGQ